MPPGLPPDVWLPLPEAADQLGITYDAARRRIKRGTLRAEKRGGHWFAAVPEPHTGPDQGPNAGPDATGPGPDPLVARLESEVAYLRSALDAEIEARRRADHLVAALMDRLPELPAGETAQDTPRTQNTVPPARETTADALGALRAWWRRMRGG